MFVKIGVIIPALILANLARSSIAAGTQIVVGTCFPCQYIGTLIGLMWTTTGVITCIQYGLVKLTADFHESWKAWVIVLALVIMMSCHWIHLWVMYVQELRKHVPAKSETSENVY
ncbi:unnamed protein product [Rotaria sp. Silwood1]|nr:unnamed protein product [Rotaria sp. Silwood1]CAF4874893.1 unnamed protein product [Rotaria sp. Silwood1]CAF4875835.1 unnamed protein product [Rotaria sp. Silwood1]